jgi:hypothetical protein
VEDEAEAVAPAPVAVAGRVCVSYSGSEELKQQHSLDMKPSSAAAGFCGWCPGRLGGWWGADPDPDAAATAAFVAADDVFCACLGAAWAAAFECDAVLEATGLVLGDAEEGGTTTASGIGVTSVVGSGSVTTALGGSTSSGLEGESESTPETGLEEMSPTSADTAGDCCVGVAAVEDAAAALWAALVAALGPYADDVVSGLWYLVVIRN